MKCSLCLFTDIADSVKTREEKAIALALGDLNCKKSLRLVSYVGKLLDLLNPVHPLIHLLIYSPTHPSNRPSVIHLSIHHSSIYSSTRLPTQSTTHLRIHSCICSPLHLHINPLIHSPAHLFSHLSADSPIDLSIRLCTHPPTALRFRPSTVCQALPFLCTRVCYNAPCFSLVLSDGHGSL